MSCMSNKHHDFLCVIFWNFVTKNADLCNKWKLNEEENLDTTLAAKELEDSHEKHFLDKEKCEMHCDNFLSNAVGVVPWRERSTQHKADGSSTTSDEVFCIATLINNCQQWTDEFKGAKEKRLEQGSTHGFRCTQQWKKVRRLEW